VLEGGEAGGEGRQEARAIIKDPNLTLRIRSRLAKRKVGERRESCWVEGEDVVIASRVVALHPQVLQLRHVVRDGPAEAQA
jgi:hypothetical protein